MEISALTSSADTTFVDPDKTGFNGLTADDFMTMLVTELQNQDPLEPMDNSQLLNQISSMQSLAANVELSDSLEGLAKSQTLSSAAGLIGQDVAAVVGGQDVHGTVDRVFIGEEGVTVGIGDWQIPVTLLSEIGPTAVAG